MARIIDTNKLASSWFTALTPVLAFTGSDATEHPPPLFFYAKMHQCLYRKPVQYSLLQRT